MKNKAVLESNIIHTPSNLYKETTNALKPFLVTLPFPWLKLLVVLFLPSFPYLLC